MKIAIGSDHGGFKLKEIIIKYLNEQDIDYQDFGTYDEVAVDYPDFAAKVARAVVCSEFGKGILCCGTGIGVAITANKIDGIRAATCSDTFSARASREHNDANVLCLGERVVGPGVALDIVKVWLESEFEGGRHWRRINKIKAIEQQELVC